MPLCILTRRPHARRKSFTLYVSCPSLAALASLVVGGASSCVQPLPELSSSIKARPLAILIYGKKVFSALRHGFAFSLFLLLASLCSVASAQSLYWTTTADEIKRMDLTVPSTAITTIRSGIQNTYGAIAADKCAIYWEEWDGASYVIMTANLDGSQPKVLVNTGAVIDIAVDSENDRIYWRPSDPRTIMQARASDGANVSTYYTAPTFNGPSGCNRISSRITAANGFLYWAEGRTDCNCCFLMPALPPVAINRCPPGTCSAPETLLSADQACPPDWCIVCGNRFEGPAVGSDGTVYFFATCVFGGQCEDVSFSCTFDTPGLATLGQVLLPGVIGDRPAIDEANGHLYWRSATNEIHRATLQGANHETLSIQNARSLALTPAPVGNSQVRITKPACAASPRSGFLALEGVSQTGNAVLVRILNKSFAERSYHVTPDPDGVWEGVFPLHEPTDPVLVVVEDLIDSAIGDSRQVLSYRSGLGTGNAPYELLRRGDILLSLGSNVQTYLYGAHWSHASVFVGAADDGTPEIAEAIVTQVFTNLLDLVPNDALGSAVLSAIEDSDAWKGSAVAILRTTTPLSSETREMIALTARSFRGTQYWTAGDFLSYFALYGMWDPTANAPRFGFYRLFEKLAGSIRDRVQLANAAICSTLVQRVYLQATGVDLHQPVAPNGGILGVLDPEFRAYLALAGLWVVPDSIEPSPALERIDQPD